MEILRMSPRSHTHTKKRKKKKERQVLPIYQQNLHHLNPSGCRKYNQGLTGITIRPLCLQLSCLCQQQSINKASVAHIMHTSTDSGLSEDWGENETLQRDGFTWPTLTVLIATSATGQNMSSVWKHWMKVHHTKVKKWRVSNCPTNMTYM